LFGELSQTKLRGPDRRDVVERRDEPVLLEERFDDAGTGERCATAWTG
jgi:hypothetical protein